MPLVDVVAANAEVASEIREGLERVIESGGFILGPDVAAFEAEFAAFSGTRFCVGLSSGTDALELVFRARGIGHGDEVVVPVNTFLATAAAVTRCGATPVFVDCDAEHLLIDADAIAARVTPRTKAIVPVHLFGQMAPMRRIAELAAAHDLEVFEDFAQSQGARQNGALAGSLSLAAATSFYPGKNLGAFGDAGAVVTDDEQLAQTVGALRNYGSPRKYQHPYVGFNCRMDSLQAVVLRAKLRRLSAWNAQRRDAASRYDALLAGVDRVRPVATRVDNEHTHHLYVVRLLDGRARRDRVLERLMAAGIGAGVHYPDPLHCTGAYAHLGHRFGEFPVAEAAAAQILSLPLFPQITVDQQQRVVDQLAAALTA